MAVSFVGLLTCTFVTVLLVASPILFLLERRRRKQTFDGPQCGYCGYNLTGAPGNRCAECGKLFIEAGVVTRPVRSAPVSHVLLVFFLATFGVMLAGILVFRIAYVVPLPAVRVLVPSQTMPPPARTVPPPVRPVMTKPIPQSQAAPSTQPVEPITRE